MRHHFKRGAIMDILFDFNDLKQGKKALKKLQSSFVRAGAPVASMDVDPRIRRTAGHTYRQVQIGFSDNQTIILSVTPNGDIFQVKVNGSVTPIKNQTDHKKAVAELVAILDRGRVKFQQKMARRRVQLPKGIKTAAPKLVDKLRSGIAELDTKITEAEGQVKALKGKLGIATDSADDAALDDAKKLTGKQAEVVKKLSTLLGVDFGEYASRIRNKVINLDILYDRKLERMIPQIERVGSQYNLFRVESNGRLGIALMLDDAALDAATSKGFVSVAFAFPTSEFAAKAGKAKDGAWVVESHTTETAPGKFVSGHKTAKDAVEAAKESGLPWLPSFERFVRSNPGKFGGLEGVTLETQDTTFDDVAGALMFTKVNPSDPSTADLDHAEALLRAQLEETKAGKGDTTEIVEALDCIQVMRENLGVD